VKIRSQLLRKNGNIRKQTVEGIMFPLLRFPFLPFPLLPLYFFFFNASTLKNCTRGVEAKVPKLTNAERIDLAASTEIEEQTSAPDATVIEAVTIAFAAHIRPGSYCANGPKAELMTDKETGSAFLQLSRGDEAAISSGWTQGYSIRLSDEFERAASGKSVEVTARVRTGGAMAARFAMAYSTNDVGNSGWQWFEVGSELQTCALIYKVPPMNKGNGDFVGLLPSSDTSVALDVHEVMVRVVPGK
jgi:hypothetical protein